MKIAFLIPVLFLAFLTRVFGQQTPPPGTKDALRTQPELSDSLRKPHIREEKQKKKKKGKPNSLIKARNHIMQLKNGVLFVRLRTSENAIKSLEKAGNFSMANTVRRRQEAENKRLIAAFQQHFTFCPVYFFYSNFTEDIKNGQFAGSFIDESLSKTSGPVATDRPIYIAEVTELEQYRPDPENLNAQNNAEITFKALVIRDHNFHQLSKPFPFFVKASQNIPPRKRSEIELVMLFNENLNIYHRKVLRKL